MDYYYIKTTNPLVMKEGDVQEKNRKDLVCDNIGEEGTGHFIKFTFNKIGLIDSVTYLGTDPIIVQSLWSFVGLHENYMNKLTSRYEAGIIPNVTEFLSENWAMALYHEWFGDFCLRIRQGIHVMKDVQEIMRKVCSQGKAEEGITREQMGELKKMMDKDTMRLIEKETMEFIKTNLNHLPMYYVPGDEFPFGEE